MNRRISLLLLALGVLVVGCSDDGPSADTVEACRQFRVMQERGGTIGDDEAVATLQGIAGMDTSASVHSAAVQLATDLEESAVSTVISEDVADLDAACQASIG